jgi:hypothetical protein
MKRTLTLALVLAVTAAPLSAQQGGGRFPRKWLVAGIGALITGSFATIYALQFEKNQGGCARSECVVPITVLLGGFLGFLVGGEMDKLYDLRYAHAPPLKLRGVEIPLTTIPNDITLDEQTVFVSGEDGVELIRAGPLLERIGFRARGLRGIGPIAADSANNLILVGTGVGLYRFPLRGEELGTMAHPGEISAVSGDRRFTALGLGPDFQITRVADSVEVMGDPVAEDARVVDLAWHGDGTLWVLTEDRLASYSVAPQGEVEFRAEFVLPSIGRRLALSDTLALVAAGSGGVYALDIQDPSQVVEVANWSGARFAYDATLAGGQVYIAAGPEGLYVARIEQGRFVPVGLARGIGFIAAVEADGESVYLLDRAGLVLRRVPVGTRQ